ncbi:19350_t:CDS:1, partial [Gigaspora margarita]
MSRKINVILVILLGIVIQSLLMIENKNDEIRAIEEMLLFIENENHRYEDKIRAKDEILLFMENEFHRYDEKLDA